MAQSPKKGAKLHHTPTYHALLTSWGESSDGPVFQKRCKASSHINLGDVEIVVIAQSSIKKCITPFLYQIKHFILSFLQECADCTIR